LRGKNVIKSVEDVLSMVSLPTTYLLLLSCLVFLQIHSHFVVSLSEGVYSPFSLY